MTIKTKSIYDEKSGADGMRILITRFYPRGVKRERFDLWIKNVSPKADLLRSFREGSIGWEEFERRFKLQLDSDEDSRAAVKQLLELSKKRSITLLCYEREGEKCHRHIVKAQLQDTPM